MKRSRGGRDVCKRRGLGGARVKIGGLEGCQYDFRRTRGRSGCNASDLGGVRMRVVGLGGCQDGIRRTWGMSCRVYTVVAADELTSVVLRGRRDDRIRTRLLSGWDSADVRRPLIHTQLPRPPSDPVYSPHVSIPPPTHIYMYVIT